MHSTKQIILISLFILFILIASLAQTAHAKSVYVITKHWGSTVKAYDIQGDQIQYQATAENLADQSSGAVALALDPGSQILFVTYESSNIIEMLNAKTMISEDNPVTVPGATSLAGVAFDQDKQKVYVVHRETNILYVYLWNPVAKTLTLEGGTYKILSDLPARYAHGIALDESADLLYVTNDTSTIHYYDTNDPNFGHKGSINLNKEAVAIAVDQARGYLYAGDYRFHKYLIKYKLNGDPNDPNTMIEKNIDPNSEGAYVIDLGVDQETGLVYATTFRYGLWGGFGGTIEVYDTSNWTPDSNQIISPNDTEVNEISGPAGVAVGGQYKPPVFDLVKDDNDVDCVLPLISEEEHELLGTPYNWLYYEIEYDANGYADTNVVITDYLPVEVDYNSSDPCGFYDANRHTVTWDINDISASDSNTLRIQVGVKLDARPGKKIINFCEMEGDLYYKSTTIVTDICCYGGDIIYVDKDANGYNNGTSWQDAYKDLQDAFTDANDCDCNQIRVAQQTYKPTDTNDRSISFELLDDVAVYGGFPPGGGQRNPNAYETILSGDIAAPNDQSDNSYHVVKCQDVNNAILDGFTITAGNANGSGDNGFGGGMYCQGCNNLTMTNCVISQNGAYYGGGVFNTSSGPNVTNCIFSDNTVYYDGGGMYNYQSSPTLINCIFSDNTVNYNGGGGMYNYQSSPTLINCTFSGNSADYGGGISSENSSEPIISNCIFSNNSSAEGGAVYNDYSDPNITNCIFTGNSAVYFGGGMVNSHESSPTITNCIFSGNSATATSPYSSYGGAIYNYNSLSSTITDCTFTANSADHGGGVFNYSSDPNITNCIFSGNTATATYSYGGALYGAYSSPTVVNCIFSGNKADYGGGMGNAQQSSPAIINCTFSGNSAGTYGGGMYNYHALLEPDITNCIFWDNNAGTGGNEIYNDANSDPNVTYSDVNGGWAGTGNIDIDPCFIEPGTATGSWTENASYDSSTFQSTLTNTDANWAVNELAGKFVNPNTTQYLRFFIVSNDVNTIKVWSDVESIAGDGDTYEIYDYHLSVDSACIDAGTNTPVGGLPATDIDGEPRVVDGDGDPNETEIVDMGADEYYWSPADFNDDGLVNFFDYAFFASAWQSEPNDDNYNEDCDLEDNNSIDYNDLALFCEDWLWQTAWAKAFPFSYGQGMGRSMGMGMSESLGLTEEILPSAPAKKPQPQLTKADIEEIIKWLAELWLTEDELRKMISEDEWLKFMEAVIQALKSQMQN